MIGPSGNVRVYLACGVTDMRRGIDGLSALVETVVKEAPGSGAIFGFRGKRADRIKLLWWDGQGFCLFYKILERGYLIFAERFGDGVVRPMARRTARLDTLVRHLGLALGGRPAARFADRLGFTVAMTRCFEPFAGMIVRRQRRRVLSASMIGRGVAIIDMARSSATLSGERQ